MNNAKLRFKGFEFNANPRTLTVKQERNIVQHSSPLALSVVQDLGIKARVVTGEGELFGIDVNRQYSQLSSVFNSDGKGLLCIPNMHPFYASFESLTVIAKPTPNLLSYSFRLVEVI